MSDDTHDALPVLPLDEQAYEYIYAELYQFQRLIRTYREIANAISMKWPRATREVRLESSGKRPECPVVPTVIKGIPIRQSGQALGFPVSKVHPLLPDHLRALINTYCDPSVTDCMLNDPNLGNAKLFLRMGEESPRNEHLNTRLTRAVYFDQIVDAACCDLEKRVKQMGVALAIIHKKGYDAAGVEFQIAFHPKTRKVSMGVGSFTRCEKPCSLSPNLEYELALAIDHNPTWPRPPGGFGFIGYDSPLTPLARVVWETFRGAYMNAFFELGNTVGQTTFAPAVVMEHVCAMSNPDYAWITGQPEAYCA
ncbi:hypothetical protein NXS19_004922 [Fusarium pseudograminearum]|nr:hypothetical protein NXS19_004922 [Fusarium pseudograminearum]